MSSERRTSPSDELLGRARAQVDNGAGVDDYVPSSPADEYYAEHLAGGPDDGADASGGSLDAAAIAAELLESGQIAAPPEPVVEDPAPASPMSAPAPSSLPGWATSSPSSGPLIPPVEPTPFATTPGSVDTQPPTDAGFDEVVAGEGDRWSTPSTEWEQRQAEKAARQRSRFDFPVPRLRTLVSLAVFGFFAIGALVPILSGMEPIADAAVGDCFTVGEAFEVENIDVVACTEPHDSELFLRVDMVPAFGTSLPDDDRAFDWLFEQCLEAFPAYTGESYEESRYWIDMFIPTADAWSGGDHTGMCTLVVLDDDLELMQTTGSGRGTSGQA